MIAFSATLNLWADRALLLAWATLWQSSLLVLLLFTVDFVLRPKLPPAIRYALWLTLLLKLLLPPSFALPTSLTWWLRPATARPTPTLSAQWDTTGAWRNTVVSSASVPSLERSHQPPAFSTATLALVASGTVSLALLGLMLARWLSTAREIRKAVTAHGPGQQLLQEMSAFAHPRASVQLKLVDRPISPAVCGLVRPVILLPKHLLESLTSAQLRTVLLHELFHISRRDVWVNCLQSLLQVLYWWHPLLWLANARIRRLREEAVDDAVVHALRGGVDHYAPALLEVARLNLRPLVLRLGLVGILESKAALRQRIERLLSLVPPRRAGLTWPSILALFAFTAVAVPMGQGPARPASHAASEDTNPDSWPDPRYTGYTEVALEAQFLIVDADRLRSALPALGDSRAVYVVASTDVNELELKLQHAGAQPFTDQEIPSLQQFSGGRFHYRIGGVTNNLVSYQTRTTSDGANRVIGAEVRYVASHPEWVPIDFSVIPWFEVGLIRCELEAAVGDGSSGVERADTSMPAGGALLWTTADGTAPGKAQIVLLRQTRIPSPPAGLGGEGLNPSGLASTPPDRRASVSETASASSSRSGSGQAPEPQGAPGSISNSDRSLPSLQAGDRAGTQRGFTPFASPPDLFTESNHAFGPLWKLDYQFAPGTAFYTLIGTNTEALMRTGPASKARREIYGKLHRIRFELIAYPAETLERVVEDLNTKTKAADPEGRGINLIINSTAGQEPTESTSTPSATDPRAVRIHIDPPLRNIRLADLLDAIVKTADKKISYSVEENGVVFSRSYGAPEQLYVRTFKVDPETLLRELRRLATSSATSRDAGQAIGLTQPSLSQLAVQHFSSLGVDFQTAPKSLFFNDREGTLIVHATLQDLDIIEAAVQALNSSRRQENIKNKLLEASQNNSRALGFDWYLGNVLVTNKVPVLGDLPVMGRLFQKGAPTDSSAPGQRPQLVIKARLVELKGPTTGLDSSLFDHPQSIVTDPLFRVLLKAFEEREDADVLSLMSVTTLSGRPVQLQETQARRLVIGVNPNGPTTPNPPSTNDLDTAHLETMPLSCGPVIDLTATVANDGHTIDLDLSATVTEFLGYDEAKAADTDLSRAERSRLLERPHPRVRVRKFKATATLSDGQTLVVAQPTTTDFIYRQKGRPAEMPAASTKPLLLFITPTIVDPAGNRVQAHPK